MIMCLWTHQQHDACSLWTSMYVTRESNILGWLACSCVCARGCSLQLQCDVTTERQLSHLTLVHVEVTIFYFLQIIWHEHPG